jgi:hypothetical protein
MVLARQKDEGKKRDIPLTLTASLEPMGTAALSFSVYWQTNAGWLTTPGYQKLSQVCAGVWRGDNKDLERLIDWLEKLIRIQKSLRNPNQALHHLQQLRPRYQLNRRPKACLLFNNLKDLASSMYCYHLGSPFHWIDLTFIPAISSFFSFSQVVTNTRRLHANVNRR